MCLPQLHSFSPSTSSLLDLFADSISGDFSDTVDVITGISGQFTGQSSPSMSVVSGFSSILSGVSSVLIPKSLSLSQEAIDSLDKGIVSITVARGLLDQTNNGYLVNIPLTQSLQAVLDGLSMRGHDSKIQYIIDYKKLFDTIVTDRENIAAMVPKSYEEITERVNTSSVESIQGLKLLSESAKKLGLTLEDLEDDNDLATARKAVLQLINYLRVGYILLGGQR